MWPQIIVLCLMFGNFILSAAKRGESRGEYEPGWTLFSLIIQFLLF
jgi:hypothetical protein